MRARGCHPRRARATRDRVRARRASRSRRRSPPGWRENGLVIAGATVIRSVESTIAVSATYRSRSVPSSARKHTSAPSRSASWASSTRRATGCTGSNHTPHGNGTAALYHVADGARRPIRRLRDARSSRLDGVARGAPRRSVGAGRRLPLVPASVRRPVRRRRVPSGPHPRRGAPAVGHAARRP